MVFATVVAQQGCCGCHSLATVGLLVAVGWVPNSHWLLVGWGLQLLRYMVDNLSLELEARNKDERGSPNAAVATPTQDAVNLLQSGQPSTNIV